MAAPKPGGTKAERTKLARSVRKLLGNYLLFGERFIQEAHPEWLDIQYGALISARYDLNRLIERVEEMRRARRDQS